MKIIVDAMGGDNAPQAAVEGALEAHKTLGVDIILVGRAEEISAGRRYAAGEAHPRHSPCRYGTCHPHGQRSRHPV